MKSKKSITKRLIAFHTFLFGIYPVLALYSFNISEVLFASIQRALTMSIVITIVIFLIYLALTRSWEKASLIATMTLILFFSYGHVFDAAGATARHRYFIAAWVIIYFVSLYFLLRIKDARSANRSLNTISLILVGLVLIQILASTIRASLSSSVAEDTPQQISVATGSDDRDIYYILIDAFGRQDVLAENYGVDSSKFISQLTDLGFYIPNCTQSNYDRTVTSLTSTLNMNYMDAMGFKHDESSAVLAPSLIHSSVRAIFEGMGYDTVTFKSLYPWLDVKDAKYHYDYFNTESASVDLASLNFQYLFLRTTAVRPLVEWLISRPDITVPPFWANWIPVGNSLQSREYRQYQQNVYALEMLEKVPDLPGKKFVYAHLYITHQPFVFYPDGRFHPDLVQTDSAYHDQILFAQGRLIEIVKTILAKSEKEPIIILQGDHSYYEGEKRVRILNAYRFPDGGNENLYDSITPVNTFRVIFNTYFGGHYELLPDISRYADSDKSIREAPVTCVEPK